MLRGPKYHFMLTFNLVFFCRYKKSASVGTIFGRSPYNRVYSWYFCALTQYNKISHNFRLIFTILLSKPIRRPISSRKHVKNLSNSTYQGKFTSIKNIQAEPLYSEQLQNTQIVPLFVICSSCHCETQSLNYKVVALQKPTQEILQLAHACLWSEK